MKPTPRPFQLIGAKWLISNAAKFKLLADEMGVGKSAQVVIAATNLQKILIVCPSSARIHWQREFMKFAGRPAFIVGAKAPKRNPQPVSNIVITSYERLTNSLSTYKRTEWDVVVFDECHYVKEPGTKRSKRIYGKEGIVHHTKRVWNLSGTPAPNNASELWIMLYTFGHTKLTYDEFITRYCTTVNVPGKYGARAVTGTKTLFIHEVEAMLSKMCLRRLKSEVMAEMPPIQFNTVTVESAYDPLKDYPELKDKVKAEWSELQKKLDLEDWSMSDDKLLDTVSVMSQSISSLRRYHGLKKAPAVADIIATELRNKAYNKIVIFAIHTDVIKIMKKALAEFGLAIIVGGTRSPQVEVDRFQNDPTCQVFLGNIHAAGVCHTLTAAHQIAFLERDWVPGNNQQAAMRVHRMGQHLPVTARFFSLPGFDERLSQVLARKAQEISSFII